MRFTVDRIDHIVLNVKDVEITTAWYLRVLGMEREEFGPHNRTALKFGGQKINVRPTDAPPGNLADGRERRAWFRRSLLHHRGATGRGDQPSA
jgi:catechol 2,3-dioxygenase-like lactoylglutathione lyase family enzyme